MRIEKEIQLRNKYKEEKNRLMPARLMEYKRLDDTIKSLTELLKEAKKGRRCCKRGYQLINKEVY